MKVYTKVVIDMKTMETIEEEHYEYNGPVAKCFGGPDIPPPPEPSAEERRLQRKQAQALDLYMQAMRRQMRLMERSGLYSPETARDIKELLKAERDIYKSLAQRMLHPSEEEEALREAWLRTGLLQAERLEKALKGELPVSEATKQAKLKEFQALKEELSRKGHKILGDNPEEAIALSTPAIQALNEFKQRWQAIEQAERRGEIVQGFGASYQRQGLTEQGRQYDIGTLKGTPSALLGTGYPYTRGYLLAASGYGTAVTPYEAMRQQQYQAQTQAAMQAWANRQRLFGDILGYYGAGMGMILGSALGGGMGTNWQAMGMQPSPYGYYYMY